MEGLFWLKSFERCPCRALVRRAFPLLCLLATLAAASGVTFTAALERDTITLGESVGLSLTFDGAQPDITPSLPPVANLQIVYNGPSSQVSFVNGQVSSRITHNFTVNPRQVGEYVIPAVSAEVGGQKLVTQALRLKVLRPGAPPPDAIASGAQPAFLRLVLPKTNVYLGEVLTGEYQLYLREGVQNITQFQFTTTPTEGLSIGKMAESQRRRVQIGNVTYTVIPISVVLTAIKTGPLSIGPITASVVVELPSNNRRRDSFMDPFGMFGNERRRIGLAADLESLRCLPPPEEGRPAGFNGAVGQYSMAVNVGPTNVATGDPITVRVQISGRGALDGLSLPEQDAWRDFKIYPPSANVETSDPLGLQGTKTFEQVIAPQTAEIKELPPLTFSFFDPETKLYRTLTHPAVPLEVRPGGSAPVPVVAANPRIANDTPPPQQDIVPIKQRLGRTQTLGPQLIQSPAFLVAQGVPVLAFVAAFLWRRRTDSLANNPRLRRHRAVADLLRKGKEDLQRLAAANQAEEFHATLFRLLQEQLGERLDCPASAITEAVVEERLRPRGVPDSTLDQLQELFQSCNLARYAPTRSSQELVAMIPKFDTVLRRLQEVTT